jgi:hypothetical protein
METRPELVYDVIEVGTCYADRKVTISSELIAEYCDAIESDNERYHPNGSAKCNIQITPPSLPVMWTTPRASFANWTVPTGGIHTGQRWEVYRPIRAGEMLRERVVAVEKYTRNEKKYVVYEATFEDANGELVSRGTMSLIWPR